MKTRDPVTGAGLNRAPSASLRADPPEEQAKRQAERQKHRRLSDFADGLPEGRRAVQRYGSVDTLAAHMSQMEELQEQIDAALEAVRLVAELRRAAIRNARLRGPAADT
jgi:hypothetical protein